MRRSSSASVTKSTQRVVTATLIAVVLALTLIGAWGRAAGAPATGGAGGQVVHHIHTSLGHAYASLGELKGASQLVVRGVVTTQRTEVDSNGVPSTVSTVQVGQPLWSRGSSAPTVLVRQLGGIGTDGQPWINEDFSLFAKNSEYILFLTPALNPGEFYPVGTYQGAFVVDARGNVDSAPAGRVRVGLAVHNVSLDQFVHDLLSAPTIATTP